MRRLIALAAVFMMVAMMFAGCGKSAEEQTQEQTQEQAGSEGGTIGLILSTMNNPFFVALHKGAEEKAAELGIEMLVVDSQNDPAKEIGNMEDLITKGVDVILINPVDSEAVGSAIQIANDQGIPVITLDRGAASGEVAAHIASDNIAGGRMAGEYIAELLGGSGNVVELEGIGGTSAARDRGQGFNEAISGTDLEVVARQVADFDRTKGLAVMENILQAQTGIDAVFAHNDEMALGAVKAIEASGQEIIVVGFDATEDAVTAVENGEMAATVAQQPGLIGSLGVENAMKLIQGESVDAYVPVELMLIK